MTRIRLLDNSVIECTLSVESTGQECLEAVAQRLELREVRVTQEKTICPLQYGLFLAQTVCQLESVYSNHVILGTGLILSLMERWQTYPDYIKRQGQSITYSLDCDSLLFPARAKTLRSLKGNFILFYASSCYFTF